MGGFTDKQIDGAGLGSCMTAVRLQQLEEYGFNWSIRAPRTGFL